MRTIFPNFTIKKEYRIDFSLIPLGVILLEFSAILTEFRKAQYKDLSSLVSMRLAHTAILLIITFAISRILFKIGKNKLNYASIASMGVAVTSFGIFLHDLLADFFEVEAFSLIRQIGSGLLQALFWFPAFVMIGSKRTEIFSHFKDYEQRLIVNTRAKSRNSQEYRDTQAKIQGEIRRELFEKCDQLKSCMSQINLNGTDLSKTNDQIQPLLVGEELRRLSMNLDTFGSEQSQTTFLGQNMNSVRLLANQFKILYETTARLAPLSTKTYALVLIILITPAFINYFDIAQAAIYFPLLAIFIYLSSLMITKAVAKGGPNAVRNSSIWLYLTGLIPWLFNEIGQYIKYDPATKFPIFVNVISLPLGYYIFMKVLQVLQPRSIDLVKNDEILASKELKSAVTKIVSDEFAHTLAHRWAIFIHGKILTRLAATALKLETAKNANDRTSFTAAVDSLLYLLTSPNAEFEKSETDFDLEIASRLDPWLGLVDVKLHIDHELKSLRNARVREVGEVIEEIISNSMRHGKAQEVTLRVTNLGDKTIEIYAIDDATIPPPQDQTRFGLGTRIFNLASDSRWSITRVGSNTVFKLVMTIE